MSGDDVAAAFVLLCIAALLILLGYFVCHCRRPTNDDLVSLGLDYDRIKISRDKLISELNEADRLASSLRADNNKLRAALMESRRVLSEAIPPTITHVVA